MFKLVAPYIGPALVLALVLWRARKQIQGRSLKPSRLWIRPAILALILGLAFLRAPVVAPLWHVVFPAAAILGVGLGYLMARHQHLSIDLATGTITSKTSPVGIVLFIGLFAARYVFRAVILGGQAPDKLAAHSAQIMMYTDAGLIFVLGLVSAQAWEMWRRAKPLLAEHAAKKAESLAE